eukprot:g11441.t1
MEQPTKKTDATSRAPACAAAAASADDGAPVPRNQASASAAPARRVDDVANVAVPPPRAAAGATKTGLLSVSDAVLSLALGYLDSDSLAVCHSCCQVLGSAAKSDDLWKAKCAEDWGEKRKVCPHQRTPLVLVPTYLQAWRAWRRAFNGYDAKDVKRVGLWWAGVEAWMSEHLPKVLETLNVGVSEEDLDRAEVMLGWALPVHLRLLYRFHNGQWLPWDERLNVSLGVDEGRPAVLPNVAGSGMSLGLLGGYRFYNHMITSKLFSLQRGVLAGLATGSALDGENQAYFEASAHLWDTDLDTVRSRGGFLLAAGHNMRKKAWVGKDGNVRFDGKQVSLMGSFDAAPVDVPPPEPPSSSHANTASVGTGAAAAAAAAAAATGAGRRHHTGGNMMIWLEEYLRRLECGHYGVKARWLEAMRAVGEAVPRVHKLRGIWLFPREGAGGCVTDVTKGVEIQASPVFVPEECSDRTDLVWTYTIRMRLLRDHPSRPPAMSSCQLSTRHWEIDGPGGFHREVSGDGVIGEYPLLSVAPTVAGNASAPGGANVDEDLPFFEYESCTTLESTPGTMGGHFSFAPGSLDSPRGAAFNARVPTFDLKEPAFIF